MTAYELVTLESRHGLLHGLRTPGIGPLALHVHGSWGNFYENPFVFSLTDTYTSRGFVYASTNNPGHDGGTMDEDLDDSIPILEHWLDELSEPKKQIVFQAHSLGALKVMKMIADSRYRAITDRLAAVVLLAPFDLAAFYGRSADVDEISRRRSRAENLYSDAGPRQLVDHETFDIWPVSAKTYINATTVGGPWDVFPTRDMRPGLLSEIAAPLFVAVGSEDFAATPSPAAVLEVIQKAQLSADCHLIEGAPHNFAGFEDELKQRLAAFLDRQQVRASLG